jgi:dipeptidyl aminopeptidase/acylaminoacyl peptidase
MTRIIMSGRILFAWLSLFLYTAIGYATAQAAPPLSVYGSLPGFEMAALSRSGQYVALIGVVNDERRLVIMDKDAKLVITAPLGNIKVRGLYWAGDDNVLIYKSDAYALSQNRLNLAGYFSAPKTELFSMIVAPLNGHEPWSVFANRNNVVGGVRGFYGIRERNGQYFGYFGGITTDGGVSQNPYLKSMRPVLYEVDLQNQNAKKVAARFEPDGFRDWIIGLESEPSATLDYFSKDESWTIRNGANEKIASGTNPLGRVSLEGFGVTPNTIVFSETDNADGELHYFETPLTAGEAKPFLQNIEFDTLIFDHNRRVLGYKANGDTPTYKFFNNYQQKVANATMKAFPNLLVHLISWNEQFNKIVAMTEGVNDPQTWWLVDIKTGQATELGVSYALHARDVAVMRMIQYKASDGLDISAVLTLPPGSIATNLPIIVLPHGDLSGRDYPGFNWMAQAFASRGYAVLQPNVRGSSGYGDVFNEAGNDELGRKIQTDISDGLAYLVKAGIADPKRACIVGIGIGGYAALAGVTLQKDIYRCAVSVGGISDLDKLATTKIDQTGGDATMRRRIEKQLGANKDLPGISPVNFAGSATAPILLVHGKDDIVFRYEQSEIMAEALRKAGKPVEFVTLTGEDHWLSRSATRLAMLEAAAAFVEKHNPPGTAK